MKVRDIKIEALRLMFAELDPLIDAENLSSYENSDAIGDYLAGMTGSINRALADITSRRILPERTKDITLTKTTSLMSSQRVDLSNVADFYDVSRLVVDTGYSYDGNAPYRMEGKTIVFLCPYEDARVTLLYYPKLDPVMSWDNTKELDIPNEIAAVIPYFIKGELYRQDEVNDAAEAMLWYEQRLASLAPNSTERQGHVASVYEQVTL